MFEEKFTEFFKMTKVIDDSIAFVYIDNGRNFEQENRDSLWFGENTDGTDIEPEYSEFTKEIKRLNNKPWDRVTLKDTGSFYEAIELNQTTGGFVMTSFDSKTKDLKKKYGNKILGFDQDSEISQKSKKEIIDKIIDSLL